MDMITKIFVVLLNFIIFNSACIFMLMSNFSRKIKALFLILGNLIIVGGSIYIILVSGL